MRWTCIYDDEARETILTRLQLLSEQLSAGFGCRAVVSTESLSRPVENDPEVVELVVDVASALYATDEIDTTFRTMASEDMTYLMDGSQGCYFYVGSADPDRNLDATHHSPRFDFGERALERGAAIMAASVVSLLQEAFWRIPKMGRDHVGPIGERNRRNAR